MIMTHFHPVWRKPYRVWMTWFGRKLLDFQLNQKLYQIIMLMMIFQMVRISLTFFCSKFNSLDYLHGNLTILRKINTFPDFLNKLQESIDILLFLVYFFLWVIWLDWFLQKKNYQRLRTTVLTYFLTSLYK